MKSWGVGLKQPELLLVFPINPQNTRVQDVNLWKNDLVIQTIIAFLTASYSYKRNVE